MSQALRAQFSDESKKEYEEQRKRDREEDRKVMLAWREEDKKKISAETDLELKSLKEETERKDQELKKFRITEVELLREKSLLKEKIESVDLEVARKVNETTDKIREETVKKLNEENRFKDAEKDKKITDMLIQIDELKVKAQQGSQQTQGEVMELELEDLLKREFPVDEIFPVAKGVKGADIIQLVKDKKGREAGKIVWESKRTKSWERKWVEDLKVNMLESKGDIAVLVSAILPVEIKNFGFKEGVYITSFETFLQVAHILRKGLIELAATKALSVGENEKRYEDLYKYLTSSEYAQYVGSIVDTLLKMKQTLDKEKGSMEKNWGEREKQIEKLRNNTLTIHGSFSGLIDEPLPEIRSLEFEEVELLVETTETKTLT